MGPNAGGFAVVIAALALIVATIQAALSWTARNDHTEAVVEGRRLDACADMGAAAAGLLSEAERALRAAEGGRLDVAADDRLLFAARDAARAAMRASYLLPQRFNDDATLIFNAAPRIRGSAADGPQGAAPGYIRDVEAANARLQAQCRALAGAGGEARPEAGE